MACFTVDFLSLIIIVTFFVHHCWNLALSFAQDVVKEASAHWVLLSLTYSCGLSFTQLNEVMLEGTVHELYHDRSPQLLFSFFFV